MKYIIIIPLVFLARVIFTIFSYMYVKAFKFIYFMWHFKKYEVQPHDMSYEVREYDQITKGHWLNEYPYKILRSKEYSKAKPYKLVWYDEIDYVWGKKPDELVY